jgi:hypothetical protein
MKAIQVNISDIIIQHPEVNSFPELLDKVRAMQSENMIYLNFDVKPDYRDTPRNWQWKIEKAFAEGGK